jgi:hypothetical protein
MWSFEIFVLLPEMVNVVSGFGSGVRRYGLSIRLN